MLQGGEYWERLLAFGQSLKQLTEQEQGILRACAQIPDRVPSERQCQVALEIVSRLEAHY